MIIVGCSYQRRAVRQPVGLPEDIYKTPTEREYIGANVGVFNFRAPVYADEIGRVAGECLYQELLKRGIFPRLTYEAQSKHLRREEILEVGKKRGYEMVITGDVLYYFEGSLHYPSRVDQRMEVFGVAEGNLLWYAKAVDIGPCYPYTDYLVVEGYGRSAPSTRELLERNADKFCELLHPGSSGGFETTEYSAQNRDQTKESAQRGDVEKNVSIVLTPSVIEDEHVETETAEFSNLFREDKKTLVDRRVPEVIETSDRKDAEERPDDSGSHVDEGKQETFMVEPIYFAFDDFHLSPKAKEVLRRTAEWLKRHPENLVEIQGHCDERGTEKLNTVLGKQRAVQAKRYLVELGIGEERLLAVSYGERVPADARHHEGAWAQNRRAEFVLVNE
jgi:peptidoglycan-associated lipoprotein